jgi:4-hydroxybenzoate polyprenyltransferase
MALHSFTTRLNLYLDLIRWNRPAGWLLLLWPTLSALWIAADGFPGWHLVAVFTLGTILMRSAGCCVNDVAARSPAARWACVKRWVWAPCWPCWPLPWC